MSEFTSFFRLETVRHARADREIHAEVADWFKEGVRATLNIGHRLERTRKVARRQQTMPHDASYAEAPPSERDTSLRGPISRLASARAQ
jgi:hypothetical protein